MCCRGQMTGGEDMGLGVLASKASLFYRTMLVTLSPRFLVVNRCGEVLEVAQASYVASVPTTSLLALCPISPECRFARTPPFPPPLVAVP